jgi:MbtH protein
MTNLFENPTATYRVLVNTAGQYSLWPDFVAVPSGWSTTGPKGDREACIQWINEKWTDSAQRMTKMTHQVNDRPMAAAAKEAGELHSYK